MYDETARNLKRGGWGYQIFAFMRRPSDLAVRLGEVSARFSVLGGLSYYASSHDLSYVVIQNLYRIVCCLGDPTRGKRYHFLRKNVV